MLRAMSRISVIGTGNMGSRMARRLLAAGHRVTVCDIDRSKLEPFARDGVATTTRAADCADVHVVLIVVGDDDQVLDVALDASDGLVASIGPHALVLVMSTVLPDVVRRVADGLAATGARTMDAPISGGLVGAAEGTLAIMTGGDTADHAEVAPLLAHLGRHVTHCGPLGSGCATKLVNNIVGVTNAFLVAEAYELALACGLDLARVAPVMDAGTGRAFTTANIDAARAQYAAWSDDASFDSFTAIVRKDLRLAASLAHDAGLALPMLDGAMSGLRTVDATTLARWRKVARSGS